MTFQKITIIDSCGLTSPVLEQIEQLSKEPIIISNDFPRQRCRNPEQDRRFGLCACELAYQGKMPK